MTDTTSNTDALSSFVASAPPGELHNVTAAIKAITADPAVPTTLEPAYARYNEEQFAVTKLPGAAQEVIISPFNRLPDGRYFDSAAQTSWAFDHVAGAASDARPHPVEGPHAELVPSLLTALESHVREHYPASSFGVYPQPDGEAVALVVVANKYSPNNFWNGRWRSHYLYHPATGRLTGTIQVDVHYYEDGNVRLQTSKPVEGGSGLGAGANAAAVVRQLAAAERTYQEDLNRAFASLSEGAFKALRRQLPVTRQKIEWARVGGYRLGQDIGGGRAR